MFSQEASGCSCQGQQAGCHRSRLTVTRHVHISSGLKLVAQLPITGSTSIITKKKLMYSDLYHLADVATKDERGKIIWPRPSSSLVTGLRQISDLLTSWQVLFPFQISASPYHTMVPWNYIERILRSENDFLVENQVPLYTPHIKKKSVDFNSELSPVCGMSVSPRW